MRGVVVKLRVPARKPGHKVVMAKWQAGRFLGDDYSAEASALVRWLSDKLVPDTVVHETFSKLAGVVRDASLTELRRRALIVIYGVCSKRKILLQEDLVDELLASLCGQWEKSLFEIFNLLYQHHVKQGCRRSFKQHVQALLDHSETRLAVVRSGLRRLLTH